MFGIAQSLRLGPPVSGWWNTQLPDSEVETRVGQELSGTIMVTGGSGFIGSNFIRETLKHYPDVKIVNYDALTYAGQGNNLQDIEEKYPGRYFFVKGNITDFEAMMRALIRYKPDYVLSLAAESHNSNASKDSGVFFETNVGGAKVLMDVLNRYGKTVKHFIYFSTCEVFGDLELDYDGPGLKEDAPFNPQTPYNRSKADAHKIVRDLRLLYGLPVSIVTPANCYGPYQFPEKVIPKFCSDILQGDDMTLYGGGQSNYTREWMHVRDCVRAVWALFERGTPGEDYNVGTGEEKSVEDIARAILNYFVLPGSRKEYVEPRPDHDKRYLLDSSKIRALKWAPEIPFDEGAEETFEWYIHSQSWWRPLLSLRKVDERQWKKVH